MINNENIRFSEIPKVEKPRSRFDRSFSFCDDFNTGELVPFDVQEVYPGDTITYDFAHVTRSLTPIAPVMDNATLEVAAFFVPRRLTWTHWPEFMGEVNLDNGGHWKPTVEYRIPKIEAPEEGWKVGSLADHLGFPVNVGKIKVDRAPLTAYCKIWNDWFRTEALKDPCYITMDETTLHGKNKGENYDYVTDTELGAACAKVARQFDYFSSALPEPQRGPDTPIPLGTDAPVYSGERHDVVPQNYPLSWKSTDGVTNITTSGYIRTLNGATNFEPSEVAQGTNYVAPDNLYADLRNATSATINQLRQAYAVQRYYEAMARGGGRMISMIENIFGVQSEDARLQRAEFCGGAKFEINIDQVLQTSATDDVTPQGNTAAYSCTVNASNLATYSATEHGIWMVVGWIRTHRSYAQGINRMWTRDKLTDFYVPMFAHLGEQAILNKEIYAQGTDEDEEVFGYQEAWAELRYTPSMVKGHMRPNVEESLAYWNYADKYDSLPHLSSEWIDETEVNVQRTLAVQNKSQWQINGYFKSIWTRVLPMYGIPGLQDHF